MENNKGFQHAELRLLFELSIFYSCISSVSFLIFESFPFLQYFHMSTPFDSFRNPPSINTRLNSPIYIQDSDVQFYTHILASCSSLYHSRSSYPRSHHPVSRHHSSSYTTIVHLLRRLKRQRQRSTD
jgi:hypothetical protein